MAISTISSRLETGLNDSNTSADPRPLCPARMPRITGIQLAPALVVLTALAASASEASSFFRVVATSQAQPPRAGIRVASQDDLRLDFSVSDIAGTYAVQRSPDLGAASWTSFAFGYVTGLVHSIALPGPNGLPSDVEIVFAAPWTGRTNVLGVLPNELFVAAADSAVAGYSQFTTGAHSRVHFAVSPDGRWLAENRVYNDTTGDGKFDAADWGTLCIVDLLSGTEHRFVRSNLNACIGGVDWSPDSGWIYFAGRDATNNAMNLYRQRPDGSGFTNLTSQLHFGVPNTVKWISDVSVSSCGTQLAFVWKPMQVLTNSTPTRIGVMNVDGTGLNLAVTTNAPVLVRGLGPYGPGDFDPEWSPDGTHISFQRATDVHRNWGVFPSHDICKVCVTNSLVTRLTPPANPIMFGISDWDAQGRICFTGWYDGGANGTADISLYMVREDGSGFARFNRLPQGATHVRWIRSN